MKSRCAFWPAGFRQWYRYLRYFSRKAEVLGETVTAQGMRWLGVLTNALIEPFLVDLDPPFNHLSCKERWLMNSIVHSLRLRRRNTKRRWMDPFFLICISQRNDWRCFDLMPVWAVWYLLLIGHICGICWI